MLEEWFLFFIINEDALKRCLGDYRKLPSPQVSSFRIKNTSPMSGSSPPGRANSPTGTKTDNSRETTTPKIRPMKVSHDLSAQITDKLSGPHGDMNKQGLVGMVKVTPPTKNSSVMAASPHIVTPPSSAKPVRPSSADRFRRMVRNCRDSS